MYNVEQNVTCEYAKSEFNKNCCGKENDNTINVIGSLSAWLDGRKVDTCLSLKTAYRLSAACTCPPHQEGSD